MSKCHYCNKDGIYEMSSPLFTDGVKTIYTKYGKKRETMTRFYCSAHRDIDSALLRHIADIRTARVRDRFKADPARRRPSYTSATGYYKVSVRP